MKVVIVNCFDTYEDRIDLLYEYFINRGYNVTVIQSNYRHVDKSYRVDRKKDFVFIETKPYYANISIRRLISHYRFAKKAFKHVEQIKPDLLYVIVPPNSLTKFASEYKKNYSNVKLIFDLIDLWPETMPIGNIKNYPPFTFWRVMRDDSLQSADFVITECDLYQTILKNVLKDLNTTTVYLAKKQIQTIKNYKFNESEIHLCYLGSINNIIDIRTIKKFIQITNQIKPTFLHIIGDGENKNFFIDEIQDVGAVVYYYGKVYNQQKKQDIFDKCHFAINIMKPTVCVGLTMKSVDYFQYGIPILNNIQGDTFKFIEQYKNGFNLSCCNLEEIVNKVVSINNEEMLAMRYNANQIFIDFLSQKAFKKNLDSVFKEIYNI